MGVSCMTGIRRTGVGFAGLDLDRPTDRGGAVLWPNLKRHQLLSSLMYSAKILLFLDVGSIMHRP